MAFKTKEEMFGDGGGFGPAVPYSTTNPPGTSAGNRGIQFGEQLTAAIANRTHYALALNDEDLNSRLAAFEVGGLNGAYDNGTVGPAGGGRDITKDAGAVETDSAVNAITGDTTRDNAHFRANSLSDTVAGSIGYDFVSKRVGANGQSGFDGIAGFLDRRVFAKATGLTQITDANTATLNPGGALPTTVRLSSGQFFSGGNTDLVRNYDLVEITGSGTADGLYIFNTLGSSTTDITLALLDGSAPALPANQACTVKVYRVGFGSFGSFTNRLRLFAVAMVGQPNATSVLDLVPGKNQSDTPDGGADRALRVMGKTGGGSASEMFSVDYLGRLQQSMDWTGIIDEADRNTRFGSYFSWKQHLTNPGIGHIIQSYDPAVTSRHDFLSLFPYDPPTTPAITPGTGVTMTFTANSPTQGELLFNSPQDALLAYWFFHVGMMLEISGATTSNGLYVIKKLVTTGNGGFQLLKADGSVTSHFPAAGTCTLNAIYFSQGVGRRYNFANATGLTGSPTTVTSFNLFTGGYESDTAVIVTALPTNTIGASAKRAHVRMFASNPGVGDHYKEVFAIDADGNLNTAGSMTAAGGATADSLTMVTASAVNTPTTDKTFNCDLRLGQPEQDAAGAPLWRFDRANGWWELITLGGGGDAAIYFPIVWGGRLMTTYVQAFASSGSLHSVYAALQITAPVWGSPGTAPGVTNANESTIVFANNAWGESFINHSLGSGTLLSFGTNNYAIRIRGERVGDRIRAIKFNVRYVGIGVGGIGG